MWKKVDCISEIRIKSSFDKYNKVFYIYIYIYSGKTSVKASR